jgi:hypothetical protein
MATTTSTNFKNFIGGEWVDAASGETFESTSPATGETIGVFPRSGAEDVDRAVAVAKEAFAEWRLVPAPKRGEILFRPRAPARAGEAALTDLMTREMGKVKAEAGGDVQEAIDITYYMAGEGRRLFGHTTPSELRDKWNMSVPPADRRRRRDHAVELPRRDPVVEAHPRARCAATRSCLKPGHGHARAGRALRRAASPRRASRAASSTSSTAAAGTSASEWFAIPTSA